MAFILQKVSLQISKTTHFRHFSKLARPLQSFWHPQCDILAACCAWRPALTAVRIKPEQGSTFQGSHRASAYSARRSGST
ncbi:MAG: hypothetical protein ACK564_04165, partial [Novosphingobium sp.]